MLTTKSSPLISKEFLNDLMDAFPPLSNKNIQEHTSIIQIQRHAAQRDVIDWILNKIPVTDITEYKPKQSLYRRLLKWMQ